MTEKQLHCYKSARGNTDKNWRSTRVFSPSVYLKEQDNNGGIRVDRSLVHGRAESMFSVQTWKFETTEKKGLNRDKSEPPEVWIEIFVDIYKYMCQFPF